MTTDGTWQMDSKLQRAIWAMEEVEQQYKADRERAIAAGEARQAEFDKLAEQHQRLDSETLARVSGQTADASETAGRGEPQAQSQDHDSQRHGWDDEDFSNVDWLA